MGSSTNRNLQAKYERSRRQVRELVHAENTKAPYLQSKPEVPAYDLSMVRRIVPAAKKARVYKDKPSHQFNIMDCVVMDQTYRIVRR